MTGNVQLSAASDAKRNEHGNADWRTAVTKKKKKRKQKRKKNKKGRGTNRERERERERVCVCVWVKKKLPVAGPGVWTHTAGIYSTLTRRAEEERREAVFEQILNFTNKSRSRWPAFRVTAAPNIAVVRSFRASVQVHVHAELFREFDTNTNTANRWYSSYVYYVPTKAFRNGNVPLFRTRQLLKRIFFLEFPLFKHLEREREREREREKERVFVDIKRDVLRTECV